MMLRTVSRLGILLPLAVGLSARADLAAEVEEVVATCEPANNGAGPYWCYGAPLLVRVNDDVFVSATEVGPGVPLLCNTRWRLMRRDQGGWADVLHPEAFREREPCPIVTTGADRLMVSVNPSTEPPGTEYGPCDPHLVAVDARDPGRPTSAVRPEWPGEPTFTDHSYRGIAVDRERGEFLLLNIDARTSEQNWAFGDSTEGFTRYGTIQFPIRSCYPQVALRDGQAHVMAIGDIVEPNESWRAHKKEQTGAAWDYVFRRLFYTRSPDVANSSFEPPIEVASVDDRGGHITNLDLWLDQDGAAHLLYLTTSTTSPIRDRFFPGEPIVTTLEHATIDDGRLVDREALVVGGEGQPETPLYGRFHATADGSPHVVYSARIQSPDGSARLENRVLSLGAGRSDGPTTLKLQEPLSMFFTATERGGSEPSDVLDLLGSGRDSRTLRYARVRLR